MSEKGVRLGINIGEVYPGSAVRGCAPPPKPPPTLTADDVTYVLGPAGNEAVLAKLLGPNTAAWLCGRKTGMCLIHNRPGAECRRRQAVES